jgi:hypothetical protein
MSILHAVKELRYEALFVLTEREKYKEKLRRQAYKD